MSCVDRNDQDTFQKNLTRVAWLLPAMGTGGISFQHLLSEFSLTFPNTIAFTGQWPGYAKGFENTFNVQEVGATRYIEFARTVNGYTIGFSYASPQIISHLFRFKPDIIFANAFTAWTAIALLLKIFGHWKVIVTYEGGSPTYESQSPSLRLAVRRIMMRSIDAFIVNSQSGETYLSDVLGVNECRIFTKPFLVPSIEALLHNSEDKTIALSAEARRPIFLFVGQIIPRKGLKTLLEACLELNKGGYHDYTLVVVGDGEQRQELQAFAEQYGLSNQVKWVGKVEYYCLGLYFQYSDIFVFPTYEDIWGMVLTEAMAFSKPIICSARAGAVELVRNGENGFIFNPEKSAELAELMLKFISNPSLICSMGEKSKHIMIDHTPKEAIKPFLEAVKFLNEGQ
jgi:glycosyltransferase involved in cell wall biosynthesis